MSLWTKTITLPMAKLYIAWVSYGAVLTVMGFVLGRLTA